MIIIEKSSLSRINNKWNAFFAFIISANRKRVCQLQISISIFLARAVCRRGKINFACVLIKIIKSHGKMSAHFQQPREEF